MKKIRVETVDLTIGTSRSRVIPVGYASGKSVSQAGVAIDQSGIVFNELSTLNFGAAVSGANGGMITISSDGQAHFSGGVIGVLTSITPTGGIVDIAVQNSPGSGSLTQIILPDPSARDMSVNHELEFIANGRHYTIIAPVDATVTDQAAHQTMVVDQFTLSTSRGRLFIGATLHAGPHQSSGDYTGRFSLTVVSEPIQ